MGGSIQNIAVVVPTVRPEQFETFKNAWKDQFDLYNVSLIAVHDGETPRIEYKGEEYSIFDIMGDDEDLIYNKNDGVRNVGFALAYKEGFDVIITLDDDVLPLGDTIGDHLKALNQNVSTTWLNTANEVYMRGFPYGIREESEVVLSHGVWEGVADFDASTQLVLGSPKLTYKRTTVPKGILFPMCIMNVAFKRIATPFMYQAPMLKDINRFADIWGGVECKKSLDELGLACVTGYATVIHNRASDPFVNLVKEARGVGMNEKYGEDDYFKLFQHNRNRWINFLKKYE